jgi:6-phosphogluconolactonase
MMQPDIRLPGTEVTLFDDKAAVARATADAVLDAAGAAIARHGRFRLCLAGGTTPAAAYERLRDADADWGRWWIYHGDERCVPVDDSQRNSLAADRVWLAQVPIPRTQVFPIPAELGAEEGALKYEAIVQSALPFDLVLLGIGEDGHTASLFPGRSVPAERLAMPVHESPKPPPDRVSLTPVALADCGKLLILVTGGGKAEAIGRWRRGDALPVAQVAAAAPSTVYIDQAAAGISGT